MNRVALTVDTEHPDRPARPGNVERILDTLAATRTRGTFFVQGRWAQAYPGLARRIAAEGHLIGSHGRGHVSLRLLSPDGIRASVQDAEEAIRATTGVDPRPWFRSPHDDVTGEEPITILLEELGYRQVGWTVNPTDWDPSRSPADVTRDVTEACATEGDGAIVLLHSWPDSTADALPRILEIMQGEFDLVGVDEL